jgi:hypothetical protein
VHALGIVAIAIVAFATTAIPSERGGWGWATGRRIFVTAARVQRLLNSRMLASGIVDNPTVGSR